MPNKSKLSGIGSIVITISGGQAVTLGGLMSFTPVDESELITEKYSDKDVNTYYRGVDSKGFTFVSKDVACLEIEKGDIVTTAVATIKAPRASDGTGGANAKVFTVSGGTVTDVSYPTIGADGTPGEFSITILQSCSTSTGAAGTYTVTSAGS